MLSVSSANHRPVLHQPSLTSHTLTKPAINMLHPCHQPLLRRHTILLTVSSRPSSPRTSPIPHIVQILAQLKGEHPEMQHAMTYGVPRSKLVFLPDLYQSSLDTYSCLDRQYLPEDFIWEVASSAWQIERALQSKGRGPSQLDPIGALPQPATGIVKDCQTCSSWLTTTHSRFSHSHRTF